MEKPAQRYSVTFADSTIFNNESHEKYFRESTGDVQLRRQYLRVVLKAPPVSLLESLRSDHLVTLHMRQRPRAVHDTNYTPQTLSHCLYMIMKE